MKSESQNESKHTPGPWVVAGRLVASVGNGSVCGMDDGQPDVDANARLIAAAPDLLAALNRYLPLIERAESDPAFWIPLSAGLELATANYYRAAIAKAEGRAA